MRLFVLVVAIACLAASDVIAALPGERAPEVRVVLIDLELSRNDSARWLGDGENVIARSDRLVAMLDLVEAGRDRQLWRRYRRRRLHVRDVLTPTEFVARAREFFPDWSEEPLPLDITMADRSGAALAFGNDGAFHSHAEVVSELNALAAAYPGHARVMSLGVTHEGRQIPAMKISADSTVDDPDKPDVLFTGCHHAREWISVEPPMYIARRLLEDYDSDDDVRHLVDTTEVWVVPIVNPDGLAYSQGSPNSSSDGVRLWRKNRRPIAAGECGSSGSYRGVDLNRNYAFAFRLGGDLPCPKTSDDVGASDAPSDIQLYRGPAALSELETQALAALTANPAHQFAARVDFHNYSQLVLYPWSHTSDPAPDATTVASLGRMLAELLFAPNGVAYTPEPGFKLYIATGTSKDHSYGVDGVVASFIWELRPRGCCFYVPDEQIDPINRETWAAASVLVDWTTGPPILTRVEVLQGDATMYHGEWTMSAGARQLEAEASAVRLDPGVALVVLQFSKPMPAGAPLATMGRSAPYDEITVAASGAAQGWQTTVYRDDTWVGEVVIPTYGDGATPWRLSVRANGTADLKLDASPATVAAYQFGTDGWDGYESGPDLSHVLPASSGVGPTPEVSPTPTATLAPTSVPTRTRTPSRTRTVTRTRTSTRSRTPTRSATRTRTPTVRPTLAPTSAPAATRTATRTRSATRTRTPSRTRTLTRTRTPTRTRTATKTATRQG